jgi:hypothetical protein
LWRERGLLLLGPIFAPAFFLLGGFAIWEGHFGLASEVKGLEPFPFFDYFAALCIALGVGCVIFGLVMRRRKAQQRQSAGASPPRV